MSAPDDDLVEAVAQAIRQADYECEMAESVQLPVASWTEHQARAVLSVPALRDALARDAQSSPPDLPLMQVDHAQPVPSSPDSGESRSRAAGPDAEQAEPRRAGAPPPEASSYACERADRVDPFEGMAEALARADMNIAWDRLDYATRQHYLGMARSASGTLPDWRSVAEDMALLVQILWARYPAFMSPAELVDFMDSLPEDLLYALVASTGQSHKEATWESNHPTCALLRHLDEVDARDDGRAEAALLAEYGRRCGR